jgi:REP element-mobilizing transposase RayT
MPRLPRIKVKGAVYFVTARGSESGPIFKDKDDYKMYLELVSKYKGQHRFKLFSYNMLPDRIELLIETGDDASISEIMHDLNSLYTKYFNGRYQKRGHLFESRFRSVLVEKANHLLEVTRHMHRAGADNPYSSFHIYKASPDESVERVPLDLRAEVAEVMDFLKGKDDAASYELYVLKGEKERMKEIEKGLSRGSVLGSEAFQQQVKDEILRRAEEQKEAAKPVRTNPLVIVMVGAMVLVATASSVYLFVSKQRIADQYAQLIQGKEAQFAAKADFENRSPLAPADLDGTEWKIETVPMPRGGILQSDKLSFKDGRFVSELMAARGFRSSSYILIPRGGGVVAWQAAQSNPSGETVNWQGTWQGEAMKGTLSIKSAAGTKSFTFFSHAWSYKRETV